MALGRRVHDRAILDALEALHSESVDATVWRLIRKGRDPLRGAAANGRWSPSGEFEVLYTSFLREGALAEIGYRLSLEPVWPSLIEHEIHTIEIQTGRTLRLADLNQLATLGVDVSRYETFDYRATQAISAAAHFLEFDGLIVPSARYRCSNLVLFLDRLPQPGRLHLVKSENVDWNDWRHQNRRT
jgi:hypothetical protein